MAKLYYFVLHDYSILLLHFLTSLIKFVLWLKILYTHKRQGEDMKVCVPGRPHRILLGYSFPIRIVLAQW